MRALGIVLEQGHLKELQYDIPLCIKTWVQYLRNSAGFKKRIEHSHCTYLVRLLVYIQHFLGMY